MALPNDFGGTPKITAEDPKSQIDGFPNRNENWQLGDISVSLQNLAMVWQSNVNGVLDGHDGFDSLCHAALKDICYSANSVITVLKGDLFDIRSGVRRCL